MEIPKIQQDRRAAFALLLAAAVLAMSGCETPPPSGSSAAQAPVQAPQQQYAQDLSSYLYRNFGGAGNPQFVTSWYRFIKSVTVEGEAGSLIVTAETDLWNDADALEPARSIQGALLGWRSDVTSASVYGRGSSGRALLTYKLR